MSDQMASRISRSWVHDLVRPFRRHAVLALMLGAIALACSALLMFASGYLISKTAQPGTTLFMVMVAVALVQVFGIGRPVARYFERLVSHDWVFRVTSRLRRLLFDGAASSAHDTMRRTSTGSFLEMLVSDIGHLQNLYLRVAFPVIMALLLLVGAVVLSGAFSVGIALVVLSCGVVSALLIPFAAYALAQPLHTRAKELRSREYASLTDDICGAVDIALANRGARTQAAHREAGEEAMRADRSLRRLVCALELASALVLGLGACMLIAVSAGAFQADSESANYIAAFALGFFPLIETFALLPGALADSIAHTEAIGSLHRIAGKADAEPDSTQVEPYMQGSEAGAIEFDDVSYRYPGSQADVLNHVTLSIPSGQHVAVLGRSGAGKTTLAGLLRGDIVPTTGAVRVSDAGDGAGVGGLGKEVCYLPQTPYLFDLTLRENLLMAKPAATDEELVAALRDVGLGTRFEQLTEGLDTPIGETGTGFSGGEAHRIALARALLADRPVVVLDEPFTALDPTTERQLLDTLLEVFEGTTLLVITHHLAEIERFDRVVFIEDGTVAIDGAPADLACNDARFRQLLAFDRTA